MMNVVSGSKRSSNKATKLSGLPRSESTGIRTEPCSKLGCSGRLNNASGGQIGFSQKAKYMRLSSIRSTCTVGKEVASRNNNSAAITCNIRKGTTHISKHSSSSRTTNSRELGVIEMEVVGSARSSDSSSQAGGSCFSGESKRSCRSSSAAASPVSVGPRKLTTAANGSLQGRLKNLKCNSMSDAVVPVSSSNRSRLNIKRKDPTIKTTRNFEGETSSSRAKKKMVAGSSQNNPPRRTGLSVPESSRLSKNETVPGQRPSNRSCFHGVSSEGNSPPPPPSSSSSSRARGVCCTSLDGNAPNPSLLSSDCSILRRRRHLGGISIRPVSSSATSSVTNTDTPPRSLLQQYSISEGIDEMRTAFERIERTNGGLHLDYEQQLLAMGFLTDLTTTFDQHREMRMDIDGMSYEELLALEERIGNVSTALTEEELSKCLKTDLYPPAPPCCNGRKFICSSEKKSDTKCSICQEEYTSGEKVGTLRCEHMYHIQCITQWLRLKNWCPICKASAESSSSTQHNFAMK